MDATIAKTDASKGLVYGWASAQTTADGALVVDSQGDMIEPEVMEDAMVDFMLNHRAAGEMHVGKQTSTIVESFVQTPEKLMAMGFPEDVAKSRPAAVWIGVKVTPETMAKVQDGTYKMFSIQGTAVREEV